MALEPTMVTPLVVLPKMWLLRLLISYCSNQAPVHVVCMHMRSDRGDERRAEVAGQRGVAARMFEHQAYQQGLATYRLAEEVRSKSWRKISIAREKRAGLLRSNSTLSCNGELDDSVSAIFTRAHDNPVEFSPIS